MPKLLKPNFEPCTSEELRKMKSMIAQHSTEAIALVGKHNFPNGYTASIIPGYGYERGLLEGAVMRNGVLDYSTEITDEVEGYLTVEQAKEFIARVSRLEAHQ